MHKFNPTVVLSAGLLLAFGTAIATSAQTFTTLYSFCYECNGGYGPNSAPIQGTDGNLYGMDYTATYKVTRGGALTQLSREGDDGGLIQAEDGNFYGASLEGGIGYGSVFKITPDGKLTTLHEFSFSDGADPASALVEASNGVLYGVTFGGGLTSCSSGSVGCGTVFKITPSGTLTTLYKFCSESACEDGFWPYGPLIQGTDGSLYGTAGSGGTFGGGTAFKVTQEGNLTILHQFAGYPSEGRGPSGALTQALDGDFYGATVEGGAYNGGSVFKMNAEGAVITLYSFCPQTGCTDGEMPNGGLVQASDGNFYGTTRGGGGPEGAGIIFKITRSGIKTTLYTFEDQGDGAFPQNGLTQNTNGAFYGAAAGGGVYDRGTLFSFSIGLARFVKTQPAAARDDSAINILGTNLTGATSVTFNGTAATFTVVSPSLITTTVPAGATTGTVQVVTPTGTLSSNVPFRVIP